MKRYESDPRVVTAIVSQVDPLPSLETFWRNVYLRGRMLYDPSGNVGNVLYQQPWSGVPFSRSWVIGPDQHVVLPQSGYFPQVVTDAIDGLLAGMPPVGDVNGDGTVDFADLLMLLADWGPCAGGGGPCPADVNGDGTVSFGDLLLLLGNWGQPASPARAATP